MERALRDEEAQAFRRLLRVLSHEINNSLAPIASMADTLGRLLPSPATPLDPEAHADLQGGLRLIEQRSQALQRFLGGYARLAKLPEPQPASVPLAPLCERVRRLVDERIRIEVAPELRVVADADQLEQVLINLLRNAVEAGGSVPVELYAWAENGQARVQVRDRGEGRAVQRQSVRAVLHHQERRFRHRPGAVATDPGSAAGQPGNGVARARGRHRGGTAPAAGTGPLSVVR